MTDGSGFYEDDENPEDVQTVWDAACGNGSIGYTAPDSEWVSDDGTCQLIIASRCLVGAPTFAGRPMVRVL